jgi:hypothetical protein
MNERNAHLLARYERHPMRKEVEGALTTAEVFAENLKSIRADKNLSDVGRENAIRAKTRLALRDVREFGAPINAMRTKLSSIRAQIKPVSVDKADVAGAVLRGELRAAMRGMSLAEKAAVLLGEKADPAFVDAALEAPALLSGVAPQMFEQIREQRIETMFSAETFEAEALNDRIEEAESAMTIARQDIAKSSDLRDHEIKMIADEISAKKNAPWLKRDRDSNGNEIIIVVPLQGGPAKPASPDEIRDGRFYRDHAEYQSRAV